MIKNAAKPIKIRARTHATLSYGIDDGGVAASLLWEVPDALPPALLQDGWIVM